MLSSDTSFHSVSDGPQRVRGSLIALRLQLTCHSLWEKLGEREIIDIATLATNHFLETKRVYGSPKPFRMAIDQASWWYNFALSDDHVNAIRNCMSPLSVGLHSSS